MLEKDLTLVTQKEKKFPSKKIRKNLLGTRIQKYATILMKFFILVSWEFRNMTNVYIIRLVLCLLPKLEKKKKIVNIQFSPLFVICFLGFGRGGAESYVYKK